MRENMNPVDAVSAVMSAAHFLAEGSEAKGKYLFELREYEDGPVIWSEEIDNVVCTIGKNVMLDAALAGAAYTVVGPFLGLISNASFSAVSAADTMASHAGWLEAGGTNAPTYTGNRQTAVFSAASAGAKALSPALSYTFSGSGTVQGAFLTYFTGAVNTKDSTAGTLYSAGTFGTPQPVVNGNVLTVSYSTSL